MTEPYSQTPLRGMIQTAPNPDPAYDYVVTLEGQIGTVSHSETGLIVRYVPDRLVIDHESFMVYAREIGERNWPNLESLAVAIIEDINNELVPRWVRVWINGRAGDHARHQAVIEDRQPQWKNEELLNGLERY